MTVHECDVKTKRQNIHSLANYRPECLTNICTGNVCNANCTAVNIALNQTADWGKETRLFYVLARTHTQTKCVIWWPLFGGGCLHHTAEVRFNISDEPRHKTVQYVQQESWNLQTYNLHTLLIRSSAIRQDCQRQLHGKKFKRTWLR